MRAVILAFALAGAFALPTRAEEITIERGRVAAIAYSPRTGQYGYAYNHRSRKEAEAAAMADCAAADGQIVCWVKDGFCLLALGDDKACWGVGWAYGPGSGTAGPRKKALDDCGKRTTNAHIVLLLSSDGQRVSDMKKNTTVTITDASGKVTVIPATSLSSSPSPIPTATPAQPASGSMFDELQKARKTDSDEKK